MNNEFWNALDELVKNSKIVIDRPKGTAIPNSLILFIKWIMAI